MKSQFMIHLARGLLKLCPLDVAGARSFKNTSCEATFRPINGTNGEYHFDCPVDNMLFSFKAVKGPEVRQLLASGASDDEILAWFNQHGSPKTESEIKAWAAGTEAGRPYDQHEKREWFTGECKKLGLDPAKTTLFEYLDVDDRKSFGK